MNYVFFDIECANCFKGQGKICSFGYVITDEKFNIIEKQDIVINPRSKFHLKGHGSHPGIVLAYDEAVFNSAPTFPKFYQKIRSLLQDKNNLILGFSVMSDANYIKSDCLRYDLEIFDYSFIDVQRIFTDMHTLTNTPSLIKCASEYGISQSQDIHKSDDDALLTMLVMKGMCESTSLSLTELIQKYPNSKCWCKNAELDCEYNKFKAIQRANKLSKMEKLSGSRRSNWMFNDTSRNHRTFLRYASKVFVHYSSTSPLCGKKLCISNLYEEFHFAEMMNIVSALAQVGVRYTDKPYKCDIFVTHSITASNGTEYECYRLKKIQKYIEEGEKSVDIISLDELFSILNLDVEKISKFEFSELSPLWIKQPTEQKA